MRKKRKTKTLYFRVQGTDIVAEAEDTSTKYSMFIKGNHNVYLPISEEEYRMALLKQ